MAKHTTFAAWDNTPHLSESAKAEMISAYMPHERDARTKGIPSLGSGAIYPVSEDDILCDPFEFPAWYRHCYGMDVGWNKTAAIWGALDPEDSCVYLYAEYYRGQAEPAVHAAAIRGRGDWIPGVIDPAARGRGQADGEQLLGAYIGLGLSSLTLANNAVEAGIYAVWERLSTGRLRVFRTLQNFRTEYRIYRRDEKGKIVKEKDHLMDACFDGTTKVVTGRGQMAIRDLPGTEGYVLTRNGAWARYTGARLTRIDATVIRLFFEDGSTVTCTPEHQFLTDDGWQKAQDMAGYRCYNAVTQRVQWYTWLSQSSLVTGYKSFLDFVTTAAAFISAALGATKACSCTASSGHSTTTGLEYGQASMSTTKMRTQPTTNQTIFSCSPETSTYRGISWVSQRIYQALHLPLLRSGMARQLAWRGTTSIMSRTRKLSIEPRLLNASSADEYTKPPSMGVTGFARISARRAGVTSLALITRNVIAASVARILWLIATRREKRADREAAGTRCLAIRDAGMADVYCLTVPGAEAFAIESGHIVHNCRYLCMSGVDRAMSRPVEQWAGRPGTPKSVQPRFESEYKPFAQQYGQATKQDTRQSWTGIGSWR